VKPPQPPYAKRIEAASPAPTVRCGCRVSVQKYRKQPMWRLGHLARGADAGAGGPATQRTLFM
jgi:hypothetical protein